MITKTIISNAINKDKNAINQLYEETINGAYFIARYYMPNDQDAIEDVLQEAYIQFFNKLDTIEDASKVESWLKTIVKNKAMDYHRKKKDLTFSDFRDDDEKEYDWEMEEERDEFIPEKSMEYEETRRLVSEIIDNLPIEQKICIFQYYYEEKSMEEIAIAIGASKEAVKSRIRYGKNKLRKEILALEKKGVKIRTVGILPIPFALWVMKQESKAAFGATPVFKQNLLTRITESNASGYITTETMVNTSSKATSGVLGKLTGMSLSHKIAAGIIAVGLTGGAIYGGTQIFMDNQPATEETLTENVEQSIVEENVSAETVDETVSMEDDLNTIAQVYNAQLKQDYEEAKNTYVINTQEYGLVGFYNESLPINTEVLYKLEDINKDGICEMMEVVTASQENYDTTMLDSLDVIAVRVYTYENQNAKLIYNNWNFYPNLTNESLYAEYDYTNNQFCVYEYHGGGGMHGEVYTLIHNKDGAISKDYVDVESVVDMETNDENVYAKILNDVSLVDATDYWEKIQEEANPVSAEEMNEFLSGMQIHTNRSMGEQADDIYLNANKSTDQTIEELLKLKTTTIYNDKKERYFLEGMQFIFENGQYYVTGNLTVENGYMENITQPSTHIVQENVKYKVADGACIYSMCGAYIGTIEEHFGVTEFPVGYGPVMLSNDTVYGMMEINAE